MTLTATSLIVQAAKILAEMALHSPMKKIIDDKRRSVSPDTVGDGEDDDDEEDVEDLRKKFVGEIDLPESVSLFCVFFFLSS